MGQVRLRTLGAYNVAYAVSDDGVTVVGSRDYVEAMRWRADTGVVGLGHLPAPFDGHSIGVDVSSDGSVVVGWDTNFNTGPFLSWAFRWTEKTGMVPLGAQPSPHSLGGSVAYGVSADGTIVVGVSDVVRPPRPEPVAWIGSREIHLATPNAAGVVWSIAPDGSAVFGTAYFDPVFATFRWTEKEGVQPLREPDGVTLATIIPLKVSWDGSVIAGDVYYEGFAREAAVWTSTTGTIRLGDLPGGRFDSGAQSISADGSVIVGYGYTDEGSDGFIWDAAHGMRLLRDVLIDEYGLTLLREWGRMIPWDLSADGRVIVGNIFSTGEDVQHGFVVYLGRPCVADWNEDGVANSQDFFDYLRDFFTPRPQADPRRDADMDNDDDADSADLFAYLAAFFAGCD